MGGAITLCRGVGNPIAVHPLEGVIEYAVVKYRTRVDHSRGSVIPGQQIYPHGLQYQDDLECCCGRQRVCLGAAVGRIVDQRQQLPVAPMTQSNCSQIDQI